MTMPLAWCDHMVMVVLTGKGSAPSWITKPSMRWVRTWGLTTAWGRGALSLSPRPALDKGSSRDSGGGDGKAGMADRAGQIKGREHASELKHPHLTNCRCHIRLK